jgi:uncharacterized protein YndB with AHSA1/START domain
MNTEIKGRPVITMTPVTSSQIKAVGHHPESDTLAIQFSDRKDGTPGSVYHYQNVDSETFAAFKNAESIGSHFYKNIKPHSDKHPYVKVI